MSRGCTDLAKKTTPVKGNTTTLRLQMLENDPQIRILIGCQMRCSNSAQIEGAKSFKLAV